MISGFFPFYQFDPILLFVKQLLTAIALMVRPYPMYTLPEEALIFLPLVGEGVEPSIV